MTSYLARKWILTDHEMGSIDSDALSLVPKNAEYDVIDLQ